MNGDAIAPRGIPGLAWRPWAAWPGQPNSRRRGARGEGILIARTVRPTGFPVEVHAKAVLDQFHLRLKTAMAS